MSAVVPTLPEAEIRAALHAQQWERAIELLAEHDRAVRTALEGIDLAATPATPWREVLDRQIALLGDLSLIRDETAQTLARLGRDRRGALAYRTNAG